MTFSIKLVHPDAKIPQRAHSTDTGYDLVAVSDPVIVGAKHPTFDLFESIDYLEYDTGIQISPPSLKVPYALIYPRSSLSAKNLLLANSVGVIDHSYRGNIKVRFKYVVQPNDLVSISQALWCNINPNKIYKKGDKIAQFVPEFNFPAINFEEIQDLPDSNRASGGFGSTGT
jgi:dUTP pyrophosphatase